MSRQSKTFSLAILFSAIVLVCTQTTNALGRVPGNNKTELDYVCPDKSKEPCATAKQMIETGAVIVLGEALNAGEWVYTANKMLTDKQVGEQKFKDGLKLKDSVEFWKSYIASPFSGEGTPNKVIDLAFVEVYGAYPLNIERKVWLERIHAKQAWYATIVGTENSNMNSAPIRRQTMIGRVYVVAFGRAAKPDEINYWINRPEHYRPMLALSREFLYSGKGVSHLHDVVRRVLYSNHYAAYSKSKTIPSETEIQAAIKKVTPQKLLHSEMLKVL